MAKDVRNVPAGTSNRKDVDAFLKKVASLPASPQTDRMGRLIFAMDATASREPTWDRACHIQSEMFTETAALGGLAIQLLYYRGFRECRASPWLTRSEDLLKYMSKVRCVGGQTQIARVLDHARKETAKKKVNALVFVGDCMEENPDRLCHLAGELGMLGMPCFIFHEGYEPLARRTFEQMAKLSRGAYCSFDSASARTLKQLLGAVAVYAAGGRKALESYSKKSAGREVLLLAQQMK